MFIDGVGISDYRSFGADLQAIGPFAKINLFIGQNNSGKSNILTFLTQQFNKILGAIGSGSFGFGDLDRHIGDSSNRVHIALGVTIDGSHYNSLIAERESSGTADQYKRILQSQALTRHGRIAWFYYQSASPGGPLVLDPQLFSEIKSENIRGIGTAHP